MISGLPVFFLVLVSVVDDILASWCGVKLSTNTESKAGVGAEAEGEEKQEDDPGSIFDPISTVAAVIRVLIATAAGVTAHWVPSFSFVMEILGAFTIMLFSVILPAIFYACSHWHTLRTHETAIVAGLVVLGAVLMVYGTYQAIHHVMS